MRAMILAAGRGERMRPLTDKMPKPLLEINNKPLIVWHIEKLSQLGFKEIVINIDYLGDLIVERLGDGSKWGVKLIFSDERESGALESAGGIIKALELLGDQFLVVNGDIWCDYEFESNFNLGDDLAHLILVPNPEHNPKGDFAINKERALNSEKEKFTFSGIGYYSKELFTSLEINKIPLAPILREAIEHNKISASLYSGKWFDIGTPQRLSQANSISI